MKHPRFGFTPKTVTDIQHSLQRGIGSYWDTVQRVHFEIIKEVPNNFRKTIFILRDL